MFNTVDFLVLLPLISLVAFIISWTCNSRMGYGFFAKLFYAIVAAFLNLFYILYWMIFRFARDKCSEKS